MTIFSKRIVTAGAMALALSLAAGAAWAQSSDAAGQSQAATPEAVTDETALLIGEAPALPAGNGGAASSSVFALIRLVLVLALLCLAIWGIVVFLRKSTGINVADDPYLKSVANLALGQNKSAQVLTVGGRAFLVGVTDRSVNLIAELDDKELIDAMNLSADKISTVSVAGFQSVIASFLPGLKRPRNPKAEGSSFGAELIRRQRERLVKGSGSAGPDTEGDKR